MTDSSTTLNWIASDKLKDGSNYPAWKNLVKQTLINADVYKFVLGKGKGQKPTTRFDDEDYDEEYYESYKNADYDEEEYGEYYEYEKWRKGNVKAYIILYQSCGSDAMKTIKSLDNAAEAWTLLRDRYEGKDFFLIGQSLHEFMALSYEESKNIDTFNALFKELKMKIQHAGLDLPATFYTHQYLELVGPAFPTWAKHQRGILSNMSTVKDVPTDTTLDDMMDGLIN